MARSQPLNAVPIELAGLEKSFVTLRGKVDVLKGISLTIEPGEFFVLLGPSGCGKSTLLNLIAGLEKPGSGRIRIGDRVVADPSSKTFLDPFQRDVSMVFQSYALYPHMTVEKNLAFPLSNLTTRLSPEERKQRIDETAALLQIGGLLDRKPSELSGGQRQRVAIGRALVRKPLVFLMDEPLSNLDAQLRMDMRAQLKALQRKLGITTIYVTHDQMEAMTLGDRMAILNNGVLEQQGTPVEVYDNPTSEFVARFIGSPPMNVFRGTPIKVDGQLLLRTPSIDIQIPQDIATRIQTDSSDDCILGIRPEHIELVEPNAGNMDAPVSVVENIGAELLVYCFLDGGQIVVRTQSKPESSKIGLAFAEGKTHLLTG